MLETAGSGRAFFDPGAAQPLWLGLSALGAVLLGAGFLLLFLRHTQATLKATAVVQVCVSSLNAVAS